MPLPAATKNVVEKKLDAFLGKRVPSHLADKIRLSYTFRGNSVTIWENRPPWTPTMKEWTKSAVAQLHYNPKAQTWMLYWRDRNTKWHKDEGLAPVKNLDLILAELDRDPTGIYWG
jgi:Protein of unknown function (DUF3024)